MSAKLHKTGDVFSTPTSFSRPCFLQPNLTIYKLFYLFHFISYIKQEIEHLYLHGGKFELS